MNNDPQPGLYRHFKGTDSHLSATGRHSENDEDLVLDRPLYGDRQLTVRPLTMWSEHVERDGYSGPRFSYAGPLPTEQIARIPRRGARIGREILQPYDLILAGVEQAWDALREIREAGGMALINEPPGDGDDDVVLGDLLAQGPLLISGSRSCRRR